MSLRSKILTHAIPLLPQHSFTRQTLSLALSSLPSSHPDYQPAPTSDSVLDTLFGAGPSEPSKALMEAWQEEGLRRMEDVPRNGVLEALRGRLGWSAGIREHLVEAYALLSTPKTIHALSYPLPSSILDRMSDIRLPPTYTPPSSSSSSIDVSSSSSSNPTPTTPESDPQSFLRQFALPSLSPKPLAYAWRISSHALSLTHPHKVSMGIMGEPTGSGPEWYINRLGLSLVYLSAEFELLQPYASESTHGEGENPHLPGALDRLERGYKRFEAFTSGVDRRERTLGGFMGYLGFVGRSMSGILRSRGI